MRKTCIGSDLLGINCPQQCLNWREKISASGSSDYREISKSSAPSSIKSALIDMGPGQ